MRALGPQLRYEDGGTCVFCPKPKQIRFVDTYLDNSAIFQLTRCLGARCGCLITINGCTSDIGRADTFPDVFEMPFDEFEEVLADLEKVTKPMLTCLWGEV